MRKQLIKILIFAVFVVVASCNSDESASIPSFRTELVDVLTNSDSLVTEMLSDYGGRYTIHQTLKAPEPNARIRCRASYELNADSTAAQVYNISVVTCFPPQPVDSFTTFPHDPVNVVSVWKTPSYINLCIAPLVNKGMKCKYSISADTVISRTLHSSFLFERTTDVPEAYTHKLYHSIPLTDFSSSPSFDSICIHITTYQGVKEYTFPVK